MCYRLSYLMVLCICAEQIAISKGNYHIYIPKAFSKEYKNHMNYLSRLK